MSNLLNNPSHWRERAREIGVITETTRDPEAKRLLLNLVESYERLARRAEERIDGRR